MSWVRGRGKGAVAGVVEGICDVVEVVVVVEVPFWADLGEVGWSLLPAVDGVSLRSFKTDHCERRSSSLGVVMLSLFLVFKFRREGLLVAGGGMIEAGRAVLSPLLSKEACDCTAYGRSTR